MGDDGVGPAVVEALRRRGAAARAELIDAGLAFSDVLCDLEPSRPLVVIDAVRGGGPPGSVYRLGPAWLAEEAGSMARAVSLHEVNVLPALRMEALAGREFTNVTIFGVEPGEIAWGERLSPAVAKALEKVVRAVCDYLENPAATLGIGLASSQPLPCTTGVDTA
jgi:hydrogenase maturation protease